MDNILKIHPLLKSVNIYFIIPTKDNKINLELKQEMYEYERKLKTCGLGIKQVIFAQGYSSIFSAYSAHKATLASNNLNEDDIVVMCHDDISIQTKPEYFIKILKEALEPKSVGFVGVAGTTNLREDAVWWSGWKEGFCKGFALHGKEMTPTLYGHNGRVVVLDGLFLACTWRTLKQIDLTKPTNFVGDWDFYDLYYTLQAHKLGLCNLTVPIIVNHMSRGELVGKQGWYENRQKFIGMNNFPISV